MDCRRSSGLPGRLFHHWSEPAGCRARTAWTTAMIQIVEHRNLRRSRQVLRVTVACSTSARIFVWDRLTAFWPVERVCHRPRHGVRTVPGAPVALVGPARDVGMNKSVDDAVFAVRSDVVDDSGRAGPRRCDRSAGARHPGARTPSSTWCGRHRLKRASSVTCGLAQSSPQPAVPGRLRAARLHEFKFQWPPSNWWETSGARWSCRGVGLGFRRDYLVGGYLLH